MSNPFRYFDSSPEMVRLMVMTHVKYLLSLCNIEDLLAEQAIDIRHETGGSGGTGLARCSQPRSAKGAFRG
jgi:hypothetical protein